MTLNYLGEPGRILELWRAASIARSLPAMRELYSDDAIYEFPFTAAGFPARLDGRAAILDFLAATWATGLVSYKRYETIAAYRTADDPAVIIVEQTVHGTSPASGVFTLPNLLIAEVTDNRIKRLRDYANLVAASQALGTRNLNLS